VGGRRPPPGLYRRCRRRAARHPRGNGLDASRTSGTPVTEAVDGVVVDHADGLHERVTDRRAHEGEPALAERPAEGVRLRGLVRHLLDGAPAVASWPPAHHCPHEPVETLAAGPESEDGARVLDRSADLPLVADDARIGQEPAHGPLPEGGDPARHEPRERTPVAGALPEDGQPREAGLGAFEDEHLEEPALVVDGDAPLPVVVGQVKGIGADPAAAASLAHDPPSVPQDRAPRLPGAAAFGPGRYAMLRVLRWVVR